MDAEKLKELRELVAGAKTGPKELPENEALFVAAVNALPALLDEVEALTALLRRVRTHLAVGCVARAGYTTRHTELAIEINAARHEPKDAER